MWPFLFLRQEQQDHVPIPPLPDLLMYIYRSCKYVMCHHHCHQKHVSWQGFCIALPNSCKQGTTGKGNHARSLSCSQFSAKSSRSRGHSLTSFVPVNTCQQRNCSVVFSMAPIVGPNVCWNEGAAPTNWKLQPLHVALHKPPGILTPSLVYFHDERWWMTSDREFMT